METAERLPIEKIPEWARGYAIKQIKKEEKQVKQITLTDFPARPEIKTGSADLLHMNYKDKCEYYGYDPKNIISGYVLNQYSAPNEKAIKRVMAPLVIKVVGKKHKAAA